MKYIYKICSVFLMTLFITGCMRIVNFSPIPPQTVLSYSNGREVLDCQGETLSLGREVKSFWRKNNLPKGTIEFVCVDGKVYLLKDAPAGSIDDRSKLP